MNAARSFQMDVEVTGLTVKVQCPGHGDVCGNGGIAALFITPTLDWSWW